jgi:spore coat polysaccharide biosynthesis protein SpsF
MKMSSLPQKIGLIVQARTGSERFPGKVLEVLGRVPNQAPLLSQLLKAMRLIPALKIVATSDHLKDQAVASLASEEGWQVFAGDEANVASRFIGVVDKFKLEYFVRLNGDSPWMDYRIVERGLNQLFKELSKGNRPLVISTVLNRSVPSGMNVEIIECDFFKASYQEMTQASHFEHVTQFLYEKAKVDSSLGKMFLGLEPDSDWLRHGYDPSEFKFSVDTSAEMDQMKAMFLSLDRPHWEYTMAEKCVIFRQKLKET